MLVVHAGNRIDDPDRPRPRFPSDRVQAVADRLGELLDVLAPEGVVTSAAAGADLLMVEAAGEAAAARPPPAAVPAGPVPRRLGRGSGPALGDGVRHAVEHAVDHPSSLIELDLEPGVEGLEAGNQALLDHTSALARTGGLLVVAVRPPGGEVPPSVTDDFVRRAVDAGRFVIEIDPRR